MITTAKKIDNAILWIESLVGCNFKQGQGMLGDDEGGFCCLGLGSFMMDVPFEPEWDLPIDMKFSSKVGLLSVDGEFCGDECFGDIAFTEMFPEEIVGGLSLYCLNDDTGIGFKGIQKWITTYPEYYFEKGVAKGIREVYHG